MIRRHVELTQRLAALVRADDRFEIVAPHPLNLLCIRLAAGDDATDRLIEDANATGSVLFTRTVLDGRSTLRFSIGSSTTEWRHVAAAWRLLQSLA
jgi:aromatic-L-amino-acid/L-tryptophan decarboxylase